MVGMIKDHVCDHGKSPGTDLPGAWMGPIGMCECCGSTFGYTNSANWSSNGKVNKRSGRFWTPRNRCSTCGGGYIEY